MENHPAYTTFQFTKTDDNVSVETEIKEEIYLVEKKEKEQLSYNPCENNVKSLANLNQQ